MLKISRFTCENMKNGCITDEIYPKFSFALESDGENVELKSAEISVNGWTETVNRQIAIPYEGKPLEPFTKYIAKVDVIDTSGETATAILEFETGRLDIPWKANWISDGAYIFKEKRISPKPMTFKKVFSIDKRILSAKVYSTAIGIYELLLNGSKVGSDYFAPGFTSYNKHLQYQVYDITKMLTNKNTIIAVVSGGWAVGSFVFTRKNRINADRQALLLEILVTYEDGTSDVIVTDETWEVTEEGNYQMADIYDGETYDATVDLNNITWRYAIKEVLRISPEIKVSYGAPVRAQEKLVPISCKTIGNKLVYDFGQNFAGVVELKIKGIYGNVVTVKHAEILNPDGTLNTIFLRTAKACATYKCLDGEQVYSPRLTYMGFRYISISGIEKENIEVSAWVLSSALEQIGEFRCSNKSLNRLQENIVWSSKSNFMDIPTDCPQRDERMGWTGDIALFAPTACYNFNMSRFLDKWLQDMRAEQISTGGIPNTIPAQGYGFPATMPTMAIDFWGDACILVPWAEYCSRGDRSILEKNYPMMKKYVEACKFWAGLFGIGHRRYIWNTPSVLHFGDWVAPDVPKMKQWQKRSKWTATASLRNTTLRLSQIAQIIGKQEDAIYYKKLSNKVSEAYRAVLTNGKGKLKKEFQTAYVLPIYFEVFHGEEKKKAVENLVKLVEKSEYCIGTGFPGTPYILFVLADNGYSDVAYKMLLNEKCPSWLYQIKMGATTIWERWDGLDEFGVCPVGDDGTDIMVSYNHYASGAVGDFLYRRIAGIEPLEGGYKKFKIAPMLGGDIKYATGSVETPYGKVVSDWRIEENKFSISVEVPVGTNCELQLPDGKKYQLTNGKHFLETKLLNF